MVLCWCEWLVTLRNVRLTLTLEHMKKICTLLLAGAAFAQLRAQVVVNITEPLSIQGNVLSTWADPAQGWGTPDMLDVTNAITDTLALAFDGSASADSLCCEAIINRSEIQGKIAVLYRGTCNFSLKALNCQDSGAVAVIIINNTPDTPIPMGAGTFGADVTIPTFLVDQLGGQAVAAALANGEIVVAFLGNKTGYFDFDLGFYGPDMLTPPSAAIPALLAQNASEYSPILGAWVRNYGSSPQVAATLNITVTQGGNPVYNETSAPFDVPSADSAFIELPALALSSYSGFYNITYTVVSPAAEEYAADNTFSSSLNVGNLFSYAEISETTLLPASSAGVAPGTSSGTYTYCVHFRDANASRLAATGIEALVAVNAPSSVNGEILSVQAFEWLDEFTGLSDANFALDNLVEVANGEIIVEIDSTRYRGFIPFTEPWPLQDNVRYLFCLVTENPDIFLGSDDRLDYTTNQEFNDQPVTPVQNGTTWNSGFAGTISNSAVRMVDVNSIGIAEQTKTESQAYPNPAVNELRIPLRSFTGAADLRILDLAGKVVSAQRVTATGSHLLVNVAGIAPGTYNFSVTPENGQQSTFKVVVSR